MDPIPLNSNYTTEWKSAFIYIVVSVKILTVTNIAGEVSSKRLRIVLIEY